MPLIKTPLPHAVPPPTGQADWRAQVDLLQTGTPEQRWSAARALAAQPEATAALGAALDLPASPQLREAIFTSLAKLNSPASFDAVLRQLRSDDAQLRSFALDAMLLMPQLIGQRLHALLSDDDQDIRILACDLARHLPLAEAVLALSGVLTGEPVVNVCTAAIDVLADLAGPAELPLLAACAARFPSAFFVGFSVRTASERIRARCEV